MVGYILDAWGKISNFTANILILTGWWDVIFLFPRSFFKRFRFFRGLKNGVLIIRWDRIGDAAVWLPYAAAMVDYFHRKGEKVTLLCSPEMVEMYRELTRFDDYIPLEVNQYMTSRAFRKKILKEIARRRFAIICNPRAAREFLVDDLIAMAASTAKTYGLEHPGRLINPFVQKWTRWCYSKLLQVPSEVNTEIEFAELFNHMVIGHRRPDCEANRRMTSLLSPATGVDYYVVLPEAYDSYRSWPKEKFIEIICWLATERPDLYPVLAGGPSGVSLCEAIAESLPENKLINLTGKTSLKDMIGLISKARFVIGNESGGIHLAAAAGVKSFCLAGYGHWGRFVPYPEPYPVPCVITPVVITTEEKCIYAGCNWQCRYFTSKEKRCPCIDNIDVATLQKILQDQIRI